MAITYVFDLDGSLCTIAGLEYECAIPLLGRIAWVNKLYDQGHRIIVDTSRGFSDSQSRDKVYDRTRKQLELWGLKYHELHVGTKPPGDVYIDDKGINAQLYFGADFDR